MLKRLTSVLAGCSAGIAIIFLIESVSHLLYPMPDGIDPNNPEMLKEMMSHIPVGALLLVLLAGLLGGFAGGIVAGLFDRENAKKRALVVGAVLTLLGILNLFMIPHPLWFIVVNVTVYIAGAYTGSLLIKPKQNA